MIYGSIAYKWTKSTYIDIEFKNWSHLEIFKKHGYHSKLLRWFPLYKRNVIFPQYIEITNNYNPRSSWAINAHGQSTFSLSQMQF